MLLASKVVAVLLTAALGTTVGMAAEPSAGQRKLAERLQAMSEKAQHQDCRSSLTIARDVMDHAEFATLAEPTRAIVYEIASFCASEVKDTEATYRYAVEGTQLGGASAQLAQRFDRPDNTAR